MSNVTTYESTPKYHFPLPSLSHSVSMDIPLIATALNMIDVTISDLDAVVNSQVQYLYNEFSRFFESWFFDFSDTTPSAAVEYIDYAFRDKQFNCFDATTFQWQENYDQEHSYSFIVYNKGTGTVRVQMDHTENPVWENIAPGTWKIFSVSRGNILAYDTNLITTFARNQFALWEDKKSVATTTNLAEFIWDTAFVPVDLRNALNLGYNSTTGKSMWAKVGSGSWFVYEGLGAYPQSITQAYITANLYFNNIQYDINNKWIGDTLTVQNANIGTGTFTTLSTNNFSLTNNYVGMSTAAHNLWVDGDWSRFKRVIIHAGTYTVGGSVNYTDDATAGVVFTGTAASPTKIRGYAYFNEMPTVNGLKVANSSGTLGNIQCNQLNGYALHAYYSQDIAEYYKTEKRIEKGYLVEIGAPQARLAHKNAKVLGVTTTEDNDPRPAVLLGAELAEDPNTTLISIKGKTKCFVKGKGKIGTYLKAGKGGIAVTTKFYSKKVFGQLLEVKKDSKIETRLITIL